MNYRADALTRGLRRFLTAAEDEPLSWRSVFWLVLSLLFAFAYASMALRQAFRGRYVIQDDARQHVFWMESFIEPGLFPSDLIADYFGSLAPLGYTYLYGALAGIGIDPLLASKLMPMALGLVTTAYCFGVCMRLLPVPGAAFLGALLLNQSLWIGDDLVSATPRAFVYPLFLAFLYYLITGRTKAVLVTVVLQGLFYPSTIFISAGVLALRLVRWEEGRLRLSPVRRDYTLCAGGVAITLVMLAAYFYKTSVFGPVITASQAKASPEFWRGGRTSFFGYDPWAFWFTRRRSGMLPDSLLTLVPPYAAFLLPVLLRYPARFPLALKISGEIKVLIHTTLASLFMFFAAHALLFRLHHPNRYTTHTLRIVLAVAAGLAIGIMIDAVLGWASGRSSLKAQLLAAVTSAAVLATIMAYPRFLETFPAPRYRAGHAHSIYEFFSGQPKDILIASLSQEAANLPAFARRSVLVGREFSLPFHTGYYSVMRQRMIDLITAHYTPNLSDLQAFIRRYGVDFFLINRKAFNLDYLGGDAWLMQHEPASKDALENLKQGAVPALSRLTESCSVAGDDELVVVSADCILGIKPQSTQRDAEKISLASATLCVLCGKTLHYSINCAVAKPRQGLYGQAL